MTPHTGSPDARNAVPCRIGRWSARDGDRRRAVVPAPLWTDDATRAVRTVPATPIPVWSPATPDPSWQTGRLRKAGQADAGGRCEHGGRVA